MLKETIIDVSSQSLLFTFQQGIAREIRPQQYNVHSCGDVDGNDRAQQKLRTDESTTLGGDVTVEREE